MGESRIYDHVVVYFHPNSPSCQPVPMRNPISIHDVATGRSILIDPDTGEQVTLDDDRLEPALHTLDEGGHGGVLRAFARACVLALDTPHTKPIAQILACPDDPEARERLRTRYRGTSMAASAVGLAHGAPNAAALMAAYALVEEEPLGAALMASRMARLFAGMKGGDAARNAAHQAQIDWLLENWPG
jgi:hypothetical protein